MRIELQLPDKAVWVKIFDPRDATVFVAAEAPPAEGTPVRVDLIVGPGGPKVILRGKVIDVRQQDGRPIGCSVALGGEEREKVNYLNGFVRGGLLDLRERRRLPIRLRATYGALDGPRDTYTRDVNEEGVFLIAEDPLPEESEIHVFLHIPTEPEPVSLTGLVSHTVVIEDEDIPGMGIRFRHEEGELERFSERIDRLERAFLEGALPDDCLA